MNTYPVASLKPGDKWGELKAGKQENYTVTAVRPCGAWLAVSTLLDGVEVTHIFDREAVMTWT